MLNRILDSKWFLRILGPVAGASLIYLWVIAVVWIGS